MNGRRAWKGKVWKEKAEKGSEGKEM